MRTIIVAIALSLLSVTSFAGDKSFGVTCAYGLSEFGVEVKTDCKLNWTDPKTDKTYCFSNEEAKHAFLKDPGGNVRKAEHKYAQLQKK